MELSYNHSSLSEFAILFSQEGSGKVAHTEPLPHIDYSLLYNLINLRKGICDQRELKRYDYLVQARKHYYKVHRDFQMAFHGFQDAHAGGIILDREKEKLEASGTAAAEQLKHNEFCQQKNLLHLKSSYDAMIEARNKRDITTLEFSKMKTTFIQQELPRLVESAQVICKRVMRRLTSGPPASEPRNQFKERALFEHRSQSRSPNTATGDPDADPDSVTSPNPSDDATTDGNV